MSSANEACEGLQHIKSKTITSVRMTSMQVTLNSGWTECVKQTSCQTAGLAMILCTTTPCNAHLHLYTQGFGSNKVGRAANCAKHCTGGLYMCAQHVQLYHLFAPAEWTYSHCEKRTQTHCRQVSTATPLSLRISVNSFSLLQLDFVCVYVGLLFLLMLCLLVSKLPCNRHRSWSV